MAQTDQPAGDRTLEIWLGNLLRAGVVTAALIVAVGGVIYVIRHADDTVKLRPFEGEPAQYRKPSQIVEGVLNGRGRSLIMLGLLVLIATPVARVAFSALGFVWERDWVYVAVTLIVLTLLLYSLFGSHPAESAPPSGQQAAVRPAGTDAPTRAC